MLRLFAILGLMAMGISTVPAEQDATTIVDSGSTNRPGFRIVIDPSGDAEFTPMPRRSDGEQAKPARQKLPDALVERFEADLKAAKPLTSLPAGHCMKSVSFGSKMTVTSGGEESPDLTCGDGGNAALRNLIRDANEIVALFRTPPR